MFQKTHVGEKTVFNTTEMFPWGHYSVMDRDGTRSVAMVLTRKLNEVAYQPVELTTDT